MRESDLEVSAQERLNGAVKQVHSAIGTAWGPLGTLCVGVSSAKSSKDSRYTSGAFPFQYNVSSRGRKAVISCI